jgi:hypothetical protein
VLDFLRDQIAVKKEFLRIASMARSDEPYKDKEDERHCSKDANELKDAKELKDTMDAWPNLLCIMESHPRRSLYNPGKLFFCQTALTIFCLVITALLLWSHLCESCYGFLRSFFNKMSNKNTV